MRFLKVIVAFMGVSLAAHSVADGGGNNNGGCEVPFLHYQCGVGTLVQTYNVWSGLVCNNGITVNNGSNECEELQLMLQATGPQAGMLKQSAVMYVNHALTWQGCGEIEQAMYKAGYVDSNNNELTLRCQARCPFVGEVGPRGPQGVPGPVGPGD